jgi:hypothetical protein
MSGWEMFFFVSLVVATVLLIVGLAWFIQWKRHPERFKAGWKRTPMPGSTNHWNTRR